MSEIYVDEGVKYQMVERNAKVGEKVLTVSYVEDETRIKPGDVLFCEVVEYDDGSISVSNDGFFDTSRGDKYFVLEPLEETPDITDLLANLARRVECLERKATSLEQQLRDTQSNVERQAEELAHFDYAINTVADRISRVQTRVEENEQTQSVEVVTFEKFLDSIADKVAERLVGQSRTEGGR
jgi:hypothetical protein